MLQTLFAFRGRIGRGGWWLATMVAIPAIYLLGLGVIAGAVSGGNDPAVDSETGGLVLLVAIAAVLCGFWINLAATVKRYHDRGKSGLWFLIVLVPFVGAAWQFIECGFCSGEQADNIYGPAPGAGRPREVLEQNFATNAGLAKLDDDYFKNYARNQARPADPVIQSGDAPGLAPASWSPGSTAKPAFGKRA